MIFKGLSVAKNGLRPESASLTLKLNLSCREIFAGKSFYKAQVFTINRKEPYISLKT